MARIDLKRLLERLNPSCMEALQAAASLAAARGHGEVRPEHFLLLLFADKATDAAVIAAAMAESPHAAKTLVASLQTMVDAAPAPVAGDPGGAPAGTHAGRPSLTASLVSLLQDAWLLASLEFGEDAIRSGAVVLALLEHGAGEPGLTGLMAEHLGVNAAGALRKSFRELTESSGEATPASASEVSPSAREAGAVPLRHAVQMEPAPGESLRRFCINLTEKALEGRIDPVFGREEEIRRIIDILARRRKNNPILVGDAGVGKTAVAEGLALRIAEDRNRSDHERRLPTMLRGVTIWSLDIGLLEAGAGLKGEFEDRLQRVLNDIQQADEPVILFIDEAHTLIGAGGRPGGSDAANLLKPVLARGEVRTIAATTWGEYKRYFEKDAALSRRFQPVVLGEPSVETTARILRGLKPLYEADHGVTIREDALTAAAELAARYITGRFLPDKAVDLLDTAAARVRLSLTGRPPALDDLEREIEDQRREIDGLMRDRQGGLEVRETVLAEAWDRLDARKQKARSLEERWIKEGALVQRLFALRERAAEEAVSPRQDDAPDSRDALEQCLQELAVLQGDAPLVRHEVDPDAVARIVSQWTGIPLGKVRRDEAASVLGLKFALRERVRGQDAALETITRAIRAAKSGLKEPDSPLGVFLLAGPPGVGKTETVRAVTSLLFGDEGSLLTFSMSEYQERISVTRLIGSPPGYVGYGEGGALTDALRRRPYSVVLLDEAEKAHPEILGLFHHIFDKGLVTDAEGRAVDCRHSLFFLTTTLSDPGDAATSAGGRSAHDISGGAPGCVAESSGEGPLSPRQELQRRFPPALLARLVVAEFAPLSREALREIVALKLFRLAGQAAEQGRVQLEYTAALVDAVADMAADGGGGARSVDNVLRLEVTPLLADAILRRGSRQGDGSREGAGEEPRLLVVDAVRREALSLLEEAAGRVEGRWRFTVREANA